jgi:3-oxoacyl-[acyl-carrier protein] reductase
MELIGKKAWVGGATQGIGLAIAEGLALAGAEVVLVARNAEILESRSLLLPRPADQHHRWVQADFSAPGSVRAAAESYLSDHAYGIDILINNTGGPPGGPITEADPDAFRAAFEQHLICNQMLAKVFLPGMIGRQQGRIINIISTSVKQPLAGLGVSNTIRAAVANWSKTLATEVAKHSITVNNVLPGATGTERLFGLIRAKAEKTGKSYAEVEAEMLAEIPAKRFAKPEEIAAAAVFLASPAAGYITGINVPVDGGRTGCL